MALRLYNEGKLILDKKTLAYKEAPIPIKKLPCITSEEVLAKCPVTIPWTFDIYLTGGVVRKGWSSNDVDLIVTRKGVPVRTLAEPILQEVPPKVLYEMKRFFTNLFNWHTDVGRAVMPEREPVYLYKLYEDGKLCQ